MQRGPLQDISLLKDQRLTETMKGRIECGRWVVGRAEESDGGDMGTTVTEQWYNVAMGEDFQEFYYD